MKKEISRLASIAKKAVHSPSADVTNDKPSESKASEESPQVGETSSSEIKSMIEALQSEIFELCPPTLSTCTTPFNIRKPMTKGNHCKQCGHVMKGHKGKKKGDKSCSMCPNNCCSSDGKSLKCKCDYHSTTGIEVGQSLPPLEGSTMITSHGVHTFLSFFLLQFVKVLYHIALGAMLVQ